MIFKIQESKKDTEIDIQVFKYQKKKILWLKLPVLIGPLSAIQPTFDINFLWSLGTIMKVAYESPWGYYFTPDLFAANITAPMIIKLAQTPLSQGTNSCIGGADPRRFISCDQRNLR